MDDKEREERNDPKIVVIPTFSHVVLKAWIEFDGEKYIGMGSKETYDENGKITDFKIEPTGLTMRYE